MKTSVGVWHSLLDGTFAIYLFILKKHKARIGNLSAERIKDYDLPGRVSFLRVLTVSLYWLRFSQIHLIFQVLGERKAPPQTT
jgi:hypothetical protein